MPGIGFRAARSRASDSGRCSPRPLPHRLCCRLSAAARTRPRPSRRAPGSWMPPSAQGGAGGEQRIHQAVPVRADQDYLHVQQRQRPPAGARPAFRAKKPLPRLAANACSPSAPSLLPSCGAGSAGPGTRYRPQARGAMPQPAGRAAGPRSAERPTAATRGLVQARTIGSAESPVSTGPVGGLAGIVWTLAGRGTCRGAGRRLVPRWRRGGRTAPQRAGPGVSPATSNWLARRCCSACRAPNWPAGKTSSCAAVPAANRPQLAGAETAAHKTTAGPSRSPPPQCPSTSTERRVPAPPASPPPANI